MCLRPRRGRLDVDKPHPAGGPGQLGEPHMAFDRARGDVQRDAVTARLAVYAAGLSLAPITRKSSNQRDERGRSAASLDISLWQGDFQRVTTYPVRGPLWTSGKVQASLRRKPLVRSGRSISAVVSTTLALLKLAPAPVGSGIGVGVEAT